MLRKLLPVASLLAVSVPLLAGGAPLPAPVAPAVPPFGAEDAPAPPGGPLGYGFGLQLDQPFHEVGSAAAATVFFFNLSPQDTWGYGPPWVGFTHVIVRNANGWRVRGPRSLADIFGGDGSCTLGPFPVPAGTFHRFDLHLPLAYEESETGDPDELPLPGGLYTLEAVQAFGGPRPGPNLRVGPGGDPEARVPFRVYTCSPGVTSFPIRELDRGPYSGYRYGAVDFHGEDLVLRTEEATLHFWQQHTSNRFPPPPVPFVDFSTEMVIATVQGLRPSGAYTTEVQSAVEHACHIEVTVLDTQHPGPAPAVITNPYHIVAVPLSMKEVVFEHLVAVPVGDEGGSDGSAGP